MGGDGTILPESILLRLQLIAELMKLTEGYDSFMPICKMIDNNIVSCLQLINRDFEKLIKEII